jgi:hypothetical protein
MNIKIINSLLSPHYPNVENYLNLVKLFSPLFALSFLIISLFYKDIFNFFNNKRFYEPILTMLFLLGMHTLIIPVAPRYVLPIFPILFIFYGYSINNLFKKYAYIVLIILILLFSLNFIGQRGDVGFALETNMEYVDSIYIHQLAANYIENNYPNSTILAAYPQSSELKYPYNKYVNNPINVITISPLPGLTERNYTKFLYANLYKEPDINLSKIDLYYHSKQEYPTKGIDDAAKKLNLTLLKKFELNNKTVEIYLVNKLNTFV